MKDIQGYEGLYAVTTCGKVWSYKRKKFLKPFFNQNGYHLVDLYKDGRKCTHKVHRLVALAYIDNPRDYETVDHIDGNKSHNNVQNLQWLSRGDNSRKYHGKNLRD